MSEKKPTPPAHVDESIQLALAAAGTATDAAQEIQRLRKQVNELVEGSKRNGMILLGSGIFVLIMAIITVAGTIIIYRNSLNRFDGITKINRDALGVFAGEITGLNGTAKRIEESTEEINHGIAALNGLQDDLRKSVTSIVTSQTALIQKLEVLTASNEKLPASMRQATDELAAANKASLNQVMEAMKQAKAATAPSSEISTKLDSVSQSQKALAARMQQIEHARTQTRNKVQERESMIRYP